MLQIELLDADKLDTLENGKTHADGGGLYLVKSKGGAGHWQFKKEWPKGSGKEDSPKVHLSLGSFAECSIDEARELAGKYRRLMKSGQDPREARPDGVAGKATPLFKHFAQQVCDKVCAGLKNPKARDKWQMNVNVYFKPLHDKQVGDINSDDVLAVLEPLWLTVPVAAKEARGRLQRILDAAVAKKYRPLNERNPAELKLLAPLLPKQPRKGSIRGRHPALPYKLVPQFWVELRQINTIAAKTLQLIILTAARSTEGMSMRFDQIGKAEECDGQRWLLEQKLMKNDRQADVPLTATALQIIEEMRALREEQGDEENPLVFPGEGVAVGTDHPIQSENTLLKLIQRQMGYNGTGEKPKVTTHGFRRSFRSWGQDISNHSRETLEFCLHHIEGDEAELAYKDGAMWLKRKAALEDWETFVTSLEREQAGAKNKSHLALVA